MDINDFSNKIRDCRSKLDNLVSRRMPVIAGRMAVDHFQNSFRNGGFTDSGLRKWKPAQRLCAGGKEATAKYGTLLSSRNHLFSSIRYRPGVRLVSVSTSVPYAAIHNNGGTVAPVVTSKMRRWAWYRFYKEAGIRKSSRSARQKKSLRPVPPEALRWKRLALTSKTRLNIRIPQRRFIGDSRVLSQAIRDRFDNEIRSILNS